MTTDEEIEFKREVESLKKADHPLILKYIEQFKKRNNMLCIISELAPGGNLD